MEGEHTPSLLLKGLDQFLIQVQSAVEGHENEKEILMSVTLAIATAREMIRNLSGNIFVVSKAWRPVMSEQGSPLGAYIVCRKIVREELAALGIDITRANDLVSRVKAPQSLAFG